LCSEVEEEIVMGQDGIPLSIGVILAGAIMGALILAGLIVAAVLAM
jgi:uncharacterized integral membrane protein